jgi:glycosyltransferase involved in cell wall biosynthesis
MTDWLCCVLLWSFWVSGKGERQIKAGNYILHTHRRDAMGESERETDKLENLGGEIKFQSSKPRIESKVLFEESPAIDKPKAEKVVIIIPAYNEERFIGSVVLKARHHARIVIVIDDGSTDSTAAIAAEAGALVVRHSINQGKGVAISSGFKQARQYDPEVVVMLDADGQHLPEEIEKVTEPILSGQADIVIGSRYLENTSIVPRHRILGHWVFNWLTRLSSGVLATDSQSGYRAFSRAAVDKIDFHSTGFAVESEMQFIAREFGLRVVEVPITIRYTDKAKRPVIAHGLIVLNGILRLMGQYRPLLFFGAPGTVMLVAGIIMGVVVVDIYARIQILAVGYVMISVLLSIVGMLLLSTGITLHSIRGLLTDFVSRPKK